MNDLKEIGGFIVSADPYVNHDNSWSGNGTLTSPLGVVNTWQDVTSGFNVANISNDSRMTFLYNDTLKVLSWTFKFKPNNGSYGNTAYAVCTIPEQYRPYGLFELSNADGTNFCDYYSENGTVIPRNSSGYFSQSMVWPVKSAVI